MKIPINWILLKVMNKRNDLESLTGRLFLEKETKETTTKEEDVNPACGYNRNEEFIKKKIDTSKI